MARTCKICNHEQRHDIEKAIIEGRSFRDIALQFGVSHMAVARHKSEHLPQILASFAGPSPVTDSGTKSDAVTVHEGKTRAYVEQRIGNERAHVLDMMGQLIHQLERVNLLSDAVDEWLRDPDDPTRYSIEPRAEDVSVTYREEMGEIVPGTKAYSARRKEKLSVLLGRLAGSGLMIEATETKHADPRELLIKASDAVRGNLQTAMTYLEKLYGAQQVELFQQTVLEAIAEVEPDVRRHIEENLRRRHPLRRLAGGALG